MLGDDPAARRDQRPDGGERIGEEAGLGVGRVEDDHPERGAAAASGPRQPGERLGADDPCPLAGQVGPAEVGGDDRGRALVPLDERRVRGAARQGLDAGRAGAGEQVEDTSRQAGPARGSRTGSA